MDADVLRPLVLSLGTVLFSLLSAAAVYIFKIHTRGPSLPDVAQRPLMRRKPSRIGTDDGSIKRVDSEKKLSEPGTPTSKKAPKKPPKAYVDLLQTTLTKVMENMNETEWQFLSKDNGVELSWIPETNSSLPDRFRAVTVMKAPAELVFRCLHDIKYRARWDKGMVGNLNRVVAAYDQAYSITYVQTAGFMGVPGRDFLDLRRLMQFEGNRGYIIIAHSIEHPDQPPVKSSVRAFNYPNGQMIMRRDDGSCEVTYFVQVDLKGWLTKGMIRSALGGSLARILSELRDYVEKHTAASGGAPDVAEADKPETAPMPSSLPK